MVDFAAVLAQAKLPERSVPLCLRGDLAAQFEDLDRQLQDAPLGAQSLGEPSPRVAIAKAMQTLREQMKAAEVVFRLRAMPALDWAAFAGTQPERGKDEPDKEWKARFSTWLAILVSRCSVDPVTTPDQVEQLTGCLSGRQWDDLADAAWTLNTARPQIPFSVAASALTHESEPK